jgi:hypothetical protein
MRRLILLLVLALVPAAFPLSLSVDNNGFVNLGNIEPGGSEYTAGFDYSQQTIVSFNIDPSAVAVAPPCLQIQADDFRGPATLPISTLSWQVAYAQAGLIAPPWFVTLPSTYQTKAFTSGLPDAVYSYSSVMGTYNGAFQFNFLWHISVPTNQQAGTYFTNVWFTLTQ